MTSRSIRIMNLFARGNTNDGGGFDIRLYHFVAGATFGYPSLFRNFSDEVVPPLADYGTGSGTGMLYVHDLRCRRRTATRCTQWTGARTRCIATRCAEGRDVLRHADELIAVPRPNDMAIDGSSAMYVASWGAAQFRYGRENRLYRPTTHQQRAGGGRRSRDRHRRAARGTIGSPNLVMSRAAQAAMLRRGRSPRESSARAPGGGRRRRPRRGNLHAEAARRRGRTPALVTLAADPAVRAFALRALADRRGELTNVHKGALHPGAHRPRSARELEAITGLKRIGATTRPRRCCRSRPAPIGRSRTSRSMRSWRSSAVDAPLAA